VSEMISDSTFYWHHCPV